MKINNSFLSKLFILLLLISFQINIANAKTVQFAQLTDVHYSHDKTTNSTRDVASSGKNLYFAILQINRINPDFVMFLGDSIDKSRDTDIINFMEYTKKLKSPYYITLGNHDAYKVSGISKYEYLEIVSKTNKRQKGIGSYYSFKPKSGILCIVLDGASQLVPSKHGEFTEEQLKWLDKKLSKNPKKLIFIFQHFPAIMPNDDISHSLLNADEYMKIINKYKNVVLISSGHYHEQKTTIQDGIYHISAPALVSKPAMYQLITVDYDKNSYKDISKVKVDIQTNKI